MSHFKAVWDQWVSVVAVWGVGVFLLMFNFRRFDIEATSLPMIVFGSLGVLTVGSVLVSLARYFLARKAAA